MRPNLAKYLVAILATLTLLGFTTGRLPVSATANADSQRLVSLYADGHKRLFATSDSTVGQVLKLAGVKLAAADLVEPTPTTAMPTGQQFNINVYRARPVLVIDSGHQYLVTTAYQSPHLIAQAAGLTLYPEDTYQTQVITNVVQTGAIGEEVIVHRATPFIVQVDGKTYNLRTQANTLSAALDGAGIALGPKDTVSAPLAAPVVPSGTIQITRITQALATITQIIPRPVKTIIDPNILKGQSTVSTPGADGQTTATYLIHYTNGKETNRQLEQMVSQTAPVTKVVTVGTKVLFAGNIEYWRPQVVAAAAQYGFDPNTMLRIMQCESNGNATDVSKIPVRTATGNQYATGLFQYLPSTWIAAGGTADNILDGATQIKITAKVMATRGTGAWACQ